jgi:type II secretory pathway pseudopilin PulG
LRIVVKNPFPGIGLPLRSQRGVGLMEVVVATVIAVIAVMALAYSFSTGRGLVDRFEIARVALAAAQRRMERLSALPAAAPELQLGTPHTDVVQVDGRTVARESWTVDAFDDPANGTQAGSVDLKKVTVTVSWGQLGPNETVTLTRLFPTH